MPSPFPGMDPYLEAPEIWPDLHDALASALRGRLNAILPAPYYARREARPEVGIVDAPDNTGQRRIVPEVAVVRRGEDAKAAAAVLDEPRVVSESFDVFLQDEPYEHPFLEIRDPTQGHKLITLIEILSPSNKRPGRDRRSYVRKQDEVLQSDVNLIEIDLLRDGEWVLPRMELEAWLDQRKPRPAYLVWINRAGERDRFQVFPFGLRDPLPCVPVPLKPGQSEPSLDLQRVFTQAYESGPYLRGAVDYTKPPVPPLVGDDATWAEQLLRDAGLRPPA
jgi:hypothetical protein